MAVMKQSILHRWTRPVCAGALVAAALVVGTGSAGSVRALPDAYEPELVDDVDTNIRGLDTGTLVATLDHVYFSVQLDDGDPALEEIRRVDRQTKLVETLVPATAGLSGIRLWFADGDTLYFQAFDTAAGTEPRTVDLQTGAVALVADIRVGPDGSFPQQPALVGRAGRVLGR